VIVIQFVVSQDCLFEYLFFSVHVIYSVLLFLEFMCEGTFLLEWGRKKKIWPSTKYTQNILLEYYI
jgi:hypothetical protein